MKVIIQQRAGADYPSQYRWNKDFKKAQEESIRRRLELRNVDTVLIEEV